MKIKGGGQKISPCLSISFIELVRSQDDFDGFQSDSCSELVDPRATTSGMICCKDDRIIESEPTKKCEDDPDYHCVPLQVIKYAIFSISLDSKIV